MDYISVVYTVFGILYLLYSAMLFHYIVFSVIGIFKKKRYPHTEKRLRYGIIISARNEEKVIGALLDSIGKSDYPKDKIKVFLIAHNCSDKTAEIARAKGAEVYEYNNENERTLGYAYRYLFERVKEKYGTDSFDGYFIINADNVLPPAYFTRMNDAFVYYGGKYAVTSYRNSLNFGDNVISGLYGVFFIAACRYECSGRTVCGCSTRVSGTGYVFPSEYVKNGWEYVTLTEDWEFTADRLSEGCKVMYCDDAEFFDEQPTTLRVMLRQRLRWARGHTVVFFTRFKKLVRGIFTRRKKGGRDNKFSQYDIAASIIPSGALGIFLFLAQMICLALSPLFGCDAGKVWSAYLSGTAVVFGVSYLLTMAGGALIMILERKRIPPLGAVKRIFTLLLWPLFLLLNMFLDLISLFVRKLEWKAIPHKGKQRSDQKAASG